MGVEEDFHKQEEVAESIIKETAKEYKLARPTLLDEAMSFDYSRLDSLHKETLEKYMGALSQYLIFRNREVNCNEIRFKYAKSFYDRFYDLQTLAQEGKTEKEKERKARVSCKELDWLEMEVLKKQTLLISSQKEVDFISELIKTIKKVYDANNKQSTVEI